MARVFTVLFAVGFIVAVIAGGMGTAYLVGGWVEDPGHLVARSVGPGMAHLTNILFLMLVFVMIIATLLTLAERKWSALIQDRIGPNRARINLPGLRNRSLAGLPHVAADSIKMLFKESFIPAKANRWLFNLGPILAFAPVFALFAIVPAGPTIFYDNVYVPMVVATPDFGLLFIFAIASLAVYGTSLAGWSSNNKFALLGGVRASSQMISYEVALGLSLVGMMMAFGTVQLASVDPLHPGMVESQASYLWQLGDSDFGLPRWGIFLQPLGFLIFFAAAFAETKRAPFDAPEGESEIIGYFVEYSGMKFGMFMIAEFIEVVILSGVIVSIFFGGYHLPVGERWLTENFFGAHPVLWGTFLGTVFWIKVIVLCWVQLAIRWTFPRFRYDQIQTLGWKMLLPLGLVNVFVTGALVLWDPSLRALAAVGLAELAVVLLVTVTGKQPKPQEHALAPVGAGAPLAHPH